MPSRSAYIERKKKIVLTLTENLVNINGLPQPAKTCEIVFFWLLAGLSTEDAPIHRT